MGDARRILGSVDIMMARAQKERVSVIVSAVAGVSNALQAAIDSCVAKTGAPADAVSAIRKTHEDICDELHANVQGFIAADVMKKIEPHFVELEKLLSGVATFGECPASIHCRIMGMGELCCVPMVNAVLVAKKQRVLQLDSRKFIFTTGDQKEGEPDYTRTSEALAVYRDGAANDLPQILLFPGFICSWRAHAEDADRMGLLGRNGSDFSAAIIAAGLNASKV